jgi:hypothetical protein
MLATIERKPPPDMDQRISSGCGHNVTESLTSLPRDCWWTAPRLKQINSNRILELFILLPLICKHCTCRVKMNSPVQVLVQQILLWYKYLYMYRKNANRTAIQIRHLNDFT